MTGNEYQKLAMRTASHDSHASKRNHALHGLVGEIGEIHSIYQKAYQGHEIDHGKIKHEVGDLLWFIAEYVDAMGWDLDDIMELNIEKLKKRYPEGFEADRSVNRGDE